MTESTILTFMCTDNTIINVKSSIIYMSNTIKDMCEAIGGDEGDLIPLPTINSNIMNKVIEYCERYYQVDNNELKIDINDEWNKTFLIMDNSVLFQLVMAANFLDIKPLLDITCKLIAEFIRSKTPEEIREMFEPQALMMGAAGAAGAGASTSS